MKKNTEEINHYLHSFITNDEKIKFRKVDAFGMLSEFVSKQDHFLLKYSVESFEAGDAHYAPEKCILENAKGDITFLFHRGGKYFDKSGEAVELKSDDRLLFIKKSIRYLEPTTIASGLIKRSPKSALLLTSLVAFVMVSPMYSNLFNSRLVFGESTSSLLFISFIFIAAFGVEFLIKETIMKGVLDSIEKENQVAEEYLFEMVNNSSTKDAVVHWQTATASINVIWKQIGHIALDVVTVLIISLVFTYLLGVYAALPLGIYLLFGGLHFKYKLRNYRSILAMNQLSEQKLSYLVGMQNAKENLKFLDFPKLKGKWDKMSQDISRFNYQIQSHDEYSSGILKMFTSSSIIVIFCSAFFAIKNGDFEQSSVIALMLLNGRATAAISSFINRMYHVVTSYSKLQGAITTLHEVDFNLYNYGKMNLESNTIRMKVDGIKIAYEGREVLDGLSLDLKSGDIMSVTGKAGSGKSSLLKVLAGHAQPEKGKVAVNKIDINEYAPDFFTESIAFYSPEEQFVSDSLYFNFELKYGQRPQVIMQHLKDFGCEYVLNQDMLYKEKADELKLSTGQMQKLKMTRALGAKPSIIVLDEPCSALSTAESMRYLKLVKSKFPNAIIVFSTHNEKLLQLSNLNLNTDKMLLTKVKQSQSPSSGGKKAFTIN